MMRQMLLCVAAIAWLGGCSTTPVETAERPVASSPPPDTGPLVLEMTAVFNAGKEVERKFQTRHKLMNGDQIAYYVTPTKAAYVYVVQFLGTEAHLIYSSGDKQLSANKKQRVPDEGWLELFGCAGPEAAYVMATEKPLADADAELAGIVDEIKKSPEAKSECDDQGELPKPPEPPKPPTPVPAKPEPPKPNPIPRVWKPPKKYVVLQTRSCGPDPDCRGLRHVSGKYSQTANEDGVVVIEFPFEHVVGKKAR